MIRKIKIILLGRLHNVNAVDGLSGSPNYLPGDMRIVCAVSAGGGESEELRRT